MNPLRGEQCMMFWACKLVHCMIECANAGSMWLCLWLQYRMRGRSPPASSIIHLMSAFTRLSIGCIYARVSCMARIDERSTYALKPLQFLKEYYHS